MQNMAKLKSNTGKAKVAEAREATQGGGRLSRARLGIYLLAVVLAVVLLGPWFVQSSPFQDQVQASIGAFLLKVGLAWPLPVLWLVALLTAFRRDPGRVLRRWNRWLGFLVLAAVVVGGLSFVTFDLGLLERQWTVNLGGKALGGTVAGAAPGIAALRLIGLSITAGVLLYPWRSWHMTRDTLRLMGQAGRLLARAYRRYPLHQMAVMGLLLVTIGVAKGLTSLIHRPAPPQPGEVALGGSEASPEGPLPGLNGKGQPLDQGMVPEEEDLTSPSRRQVQTVPDSVGFQDLPSADLLQRADEMLVPEEVTNAQAERIEQALAQYGIEVSVQEVRPGPTVTLYGLVPGWVRRQRQDKSQESERRVTVDAILAREKDLALALAAPSLRFEAPVPGESVVGVEVPNPEPSLVTLGSLMASREFRKAQETATIPITLGKGSGGEVVTADLSQMPHLLIAGATGSGKSVMVNALLACLLMQFSPWDLRLILVDPKRVELTHYNGIPHLVTPVVVEADRAVKVLRGAVLEMTHRLRLLEERGCRNIVAYNQKAEGPLDRMPYLAVVVDEMADLMMAAPNDIEQALCRLAQLGRATGIHLVVATQRPSVDVITGLIKANFPSRISFAVASQIDSRTILDTPGAEKLLGRGDMLFLSQELPKPKRVQGAFISDEELHQLVEFWSDQEGPPPPAINLEPAGGHEELDVELGGDGRDELLDKAVELAQRYSRVSTSLLQRRLRIGYPRAARLREDLERAGVISGEGEVLFPRKGEDE